MKIYDISPPVSPRLAVFPGDTPFTRSVSMEFGHGDHLELSSITTTVHVGSHADAPSHYHADGKSIDQRDLSYYLGPCQVVSVKVPRGERIRVKHVEGVRIQAPRVLFHTGSFPDPDHWNGDFNSLSRELVVWLAENHVRLVGLDTPSIDLAEDKELESHQAVYRHNLAVLEGLVLSEVPDGLYELSALPLKLQGADAAPVRAVLWQENTAP